MSCAPWCGNTVETCPRLTVLDTVINRRKPREAHHEGHVSIFLFPHSVFQIAHSLSLLLEHGSYYTLLQMQVETFSVVSRSLIFSKPQILYAGRQRCQVHLSFTEMNLGNWLVGSSPGHQRGHFQLCCGNCRETGFWWEHGAFLSQKRSAQDSLRIKP